MLGAPGGEEARVLGGTGTSAPGVWLVDGRHTSPASREVMEALVSRRPLVKTWWLSPMMRAMRFGPERPRPAVEERAAPR